MKKIISTVLLLAMVVGALLSLASCAKNSDAPEGMQLVRGGAEYGYKFYAPKEWTVSNRGNIACAYVSKLDATSVTLVEAQAPTSGSGSEQERITEYFNEDIARFPFSIERKVWGEETTLGNSTSAYKFTYSYNYGDAPVGVMQVLAFYGERLYILTYTSSLSEKSDGISYYDSYLEKLSSIFTSIVFTDKSGEPIKNEYESDANGYITVSDKNVAGFTMSVPDAYRVDYSSGIVSVTRDDGTNISMSKATYTGVDKDTYWKERKSDLEQIVDKTVNENSEEVSTLREIAGGISVKVVLDGVKWAYSYEYTYELSGEKYHVYQVLIVKGMSGYVFTYTAKEANYLSHLDEAKTVLTRIEY